MNLKTLKHSFLSLLCFLFLYTPLSQTFAEDYVPSFTIQIPMRDNLALPTDIYLPDLAAEGLPCILVRTPAGRQSYKEVYAPLAKAGYVVAIQDTRSQIDPEGKTFPYVSDGWGNLQDGYDTVKWLSDSSFTNGKIGTMGFSAMGITQLLMAPTAPKGLECQYIGMAAGSLYHHAIYVGGQLLKNQVEGWLGLHARHPSVLNHVVNSPYYNDFWQGMDTLPLAKKVEVPALFYSGWFDTFSQGTLDAFVVRQEQGGEGAKGRQKLIMGPWTHFWPLSFQIGDFEVPDIAKMPPVDISPLSWFNHYLKGEENNIDQLATVTYFVMGPFDGSPSSGNVWRSADRWPVPSTPTPLYLDCKGNLKGSPVSKACTFAYTYDPKDPVPTVGGHNLFLESGPKDQRPIEKREDVLVFSTEPLKEDLEVTGRLKAKLYVTSDQPDTDIVVRLCDVYPDGRSILISDGLCRLCMSKQPKKQRLSQDPQEIEVDLWSTSMVFAKGHQIRVLVTSSNYPRHEKNLNVPVGEKAAEEPLKALNKVYASRKYPSQIILPVVTFGEKKAVAASNISR